MTYDSREQSEFDGFPIELYTFTRGGSVWRYTSADEDKTIDGYTFIALPMERSNFEQTQEMARNPITIKMANYAALLTPFRTSPPSGITSLEIKRYHEGLNEFIVCWLGRVINAKFLERETEVRCESVYTSLKRPVLRRRYQTTCPHVLYGDLCQVARGNHAFVAELTGNGGTILVSPAFASKEDGFFSGGYVDFNNGTSIERRFILSHTEDKLQINLPFGDLEDTSVVTILPGCDHMLSTCHLKFNNVLNYGGQPFYPGNNPFAGSPVF